jgi:hypothetical protein
MHVVGVNASVVWTTMNCLVSGITDGARLAVRVGLNSCALLVALLVCNKQVLIYESIQMSRISKII